MKATESETQESGFMGLVLYKIGILVCRFVFWINGGLQVAGRENIPSEGGAIIASNHISYLDPPLIAVALPRKASFMARQGLFQIPVLGAFIRHFAMPVYRGTTRPSTIKKAVRKLKNGELLVIFPEGRRSETGELLQPKKGVGMIASLSKTPVVPALIIGSNKALPFGARWIKRAKISIIFSTPVDVSAIHEEPVDRYEHVAREIMNAIGELKKQHENNRS